MILKTVTAALLATPFLMFASGAEAFNLSPKPVTTPTTDVTPVMIQKLPAAKFRRREVTLVTDEKPGTIIVDTNNKYLYFIEGDNKATRYGIGVGREGFGWSGVVKVQRKAEWPDWTPPKQMIARERAHGHIIPPHMDGGEDNPLGARALYLYKGRNDSGFRIHGTTQPWSIGLNMSSGCIRMMNNDVEHLYNRVPVGTKVIVVGPGNRQGNVQFADKGVDYLRQLFASFER
jgi:lipoprotein-anchoring transpeptidase ErfK/SrfK